MEYFGFHAVLFKTKSAPKILEKMMVLLSDKQASKTLETLGTLDPDAELPTGTICRSALS